MSISLFCQQVYAQTPLTDIHKIWWKGGRHRALKKPLDFGSNPDHVTLGLGVV